MTPGRTSSKTKYDTTAEKQWKVAQKNINLQNVQQWQLCAAMLTELKAYDINNTSSDLHK